MGLENRLRNFLQNHPEILKKGNRFTIKRSKNPVILPISFTPELCRIIGVIHGDGNMSGKRVHVTDHNLEYHKYLHRLFKKAFDITPNIFHDKNRNTFYTYFKNSVVYKYLTEVLEIPKGSVRNFHIPKFLEKLPLELQAEYVSGIFDSESHIRKRQAEIDFTTTNGELWMFLIKFLRRINVKFSQRKRYRRKNPEFEIIIYGKSNIRTFCKIVNFKHPEKIKRLSLFLSH